MKIEKELKEFYKSEISNVDVPSCPFSPGNHFARKTGLREYDYVQNSLRSTHCTCIHPPVPGHNKTISPCSQSRHGL